MLRPSLLSIILALPLLGAAQEQPDIAALVRKAISSSQLVAARQLELRQAEETARSAASPAKPELEIAPGVGFTNSTFLLGQSIDISGKRAARARRARAEVEVAQASLGAAQLSVASEFLGTYARYLAAVRSEEAARSAHEMARATVDATRKRIEIGEAPALQLTRAEVELSRAEQSLFLAQSGIAKSRAALNSMLTQPTDGSVPAVPFPSTMDEGNAVASAMGRRPEAREALAQIEVARAAELEARRQGSPSMFMGIAADTWSLDRRPFHRDNVGLQLRLTMPLFDNGENRFAIRSAESARKAREANLKETERRIRLALDAASIDLAAARAVAESYKTGIVPKAEQMVKAMQSGFQAGLTTFLEVLEAQRTLVELRREASEAELNLNLAQLTFLTETVQLPGLEIPTP